MINLYLTFPPELRRIYHLHAGFSGNFCRAGFATPDFCDYKKNTNANSQFSDK